MKSSIPANEHPISISGRICRIARLRDEYYDSLQEPAAFLETLGSDKEFKADLFTFIQGVSDRAPRHPYHLEWDSAAVLSLSTYENWWKKQVNDKTRNMVRKAQKCGIEIRETEFSDELVHGICRIYNESPLRQGRRFRHFGKPFPVIKEEHGTFLDRSVFIGAYYKSELVGFVKLVHGEGFSNLMQIIAMVSHRDKAPTNGLIASAVERCTTLQIPFLHYGTWSRRNMGDFKKHHAFERVEIPRYFVPFTATGKLALKLGIHRSWIDKVPVAWLDKAAVYRGKWNTLRYREKKISRGSSSTAERHSQG